jgi:hypothetical protein
MKEGTGWRSAACKVCGKDFARSDTLLRHEKSHHATEDRGPLHRVTTGTFRACSLCATAKARCSGGNPCARCNIRKLECVYPSKRQKATHEGQFLDLKPPVVQTPMPSVYNAANSSVGSDFHLLNKSNDGSQGRFDDSASQQRSLSATNQSSTAYSLPQSNHMTTQQYSDQSLATQFDSGFGGTSYDYTPFEEPLNWIPISVYPSPYENEFEHDVSFLFPAIGDSTDVQMDIAQSLPLSLQDQTVGDTAISSYDARGTVDRPVFISGYGQSPQSSTSNDHLTNKSNASSSGTIESRKKRRKSSYIEDIFSRPRNRSLSYSFPSTYSDHGHSPSDRYCSQETHHVIHDMFKRLCTNNPLSRPFESANFPSPDTFNAYIELYFEHFHPTFPLIHHPTFGSDAHWIILLAVAAIGSCFDQEQYAVPLREAFQEFLRRAVHFCVDDMPASQLDVPISQARILNLIGLTVTDREQHRSLVPRYHADLGRWCLESGILQSLGFGDSASSDSQNDWKSWVQTESLRRIGYLSWLLDTSLGYLANCRPLCNLDDARLPLPCTDSMWSAKTPDAWYAIHRDSTPPLSLCKALEYSYEKKSLPPMLSDLSQILLINALFQRTWEVGTHIKQPLSEWVPTGKARGFLNTPSKDSFWLPLYPLYANWRNSACDCLDIINWQAASIVAKASGVEHSLILHLHLSRIVLLTPFQEIQDLVFSLIGRVANATDASFYVHDGSYQPRNLAKLPQIRRITWRWLREDQHKARLAMIHAGSVFWHVRRYSSQSFYEPLAVYLASMVLWTYGSYKSAALERDAANSNSKPIGGPSGPDADLSTVQPSRVERRVSKSAKSKSKQDPSQALTSDLAATVEGHGSQDTPDSPQSHSDASSDSDSAPPQFIHLDRPCDDEMVQHFVRNGHNMAGYMAGVGDICTTPNKVLLEGAKLLKTRLSCWGVSREYHDVLMAVHNR